MSVTDLIQSLHSPEILDGTLVHSWVLVGVAALWLYTLHTTSNSKEPGRSPPGTQATPGQVPGDTAKEKAVTPCSEKHEIKIAT